MARAAVFFFALRSGQVLQVCGNLVGYLLQMCRCHATRDPELSVKHLPQKHKLKVVSASSHRRWSRYQQHIDAGTGNMTGQRDA